MLPGDSGALTKKRNNGKNEKGGGSRGAAAFAMVFYVGEPCARHYRVSRLRAKCIASTAPAAASTALMSETAR